MKMTKWVWAVDFANKSFLKKCRFLGCQKKLFSIAKSACSIGGTYLYEAQNLKIFRGLRPGPRRAAARSAALHATSLVRCLGGK